MSSSQQFTLQTTSLLSANVSALMMSNYNYDYKLCNIATLGGTNQ